MLNPRQEIISLLRGQVACPLISCLGQLGWLERMAAESFDQGSFAPPVDTAVFQALMAYLIALGLLTSDDDGSIFTATALGAQVFGRYGAACILNSYEDYLRNIKSLLIPDDTERPRVDRMRNVIGSGSIHSRKFFRPALDMLRPLRFGFIADIGCGDGQFLLSCLKDFPDAALLGVDLSSVAVDATTVRIREATGDAASMGFQCNGADVAKWSRHVPRRLNDGAQVLISLWFLMHEISRGETQTVIEHFKALREHCPDATVLMGELVHLPTDILADNRSESIMPELLLIHDLSRQGLLSWKAWQHVAREIPYSVKAERQFDPIRASSGQILPSSFVWCLIPN